jgi:uncharacterized Fe-S cluster protein YjdI
LAISQALSSKIIVILKSNLIQHAHACALINVAVYEIPTSPVVTPNAKQRNNVNQSST